MQNENLDAWSKFITSVGVPMAVLFIVLFVFCLPFVLLLVSMLRKYVPKLIESHIGFMDTSSKTQETNATTLAKLEQSIASKTVDHELTHKAILLGAKAGRAYLEGDHAKALAHLDDVDEALAAKR